MKNSRILLINPKLYEFNLSFIRSAHTTEIMTYFYFL